MRKNVRVVIVLVTSISSIAPSQAITGTIHVTIAGSLFGDRAGKGILTLRHRNYPFRVQGLSRGVAGSAHTYKLVGHADRIEEISDFPSKYTLVVGHSAPTINIRRVRMVNAKGIVITLEGAKKGVDQFARTPEVTIVFDVPASVPH